MNDLKNAVAELRVRWESVEYKNKRGGFSYPGSRFHAFIDGHEQSVCGENRTPYGDPKNRNWCSRCRDLIREAENALDRSIITSWPLPPQMRWSNVTYSICQGNILLAHGLPSATSVYWEVWEKWSQQSGISRSQYLSWTSCHLHVLCNNDFPHSVWNNEDAARKEMGRLNKEDEERVALVGPGTRRIFYHLKTVPFHRK